MFMDWGSVLAQLLNFLLLVWLLQRYLFKPVLHMVEKRSQKIRQELEDASSTKEQALKEKESLFLEKEAFHKEKSALLEQAVSVAHKEKERLLSEARKEYEQLRLSLQEKLRKEQENLFSVIGKKMEEEVLLLLQKALQSIAHADLEEQIANVFLQKVNGMEQRDQEALASDLKRFPQTFTLKSSLDLSPSLRLMLAQKLSEIFGPEYSLSFEKDSTLLCGVELITAGHRVGWSLSSYLSSMGDLL